MESSKKVSAIIFIIIGVLISAIVGGVIWYFVANRPIACTQEAKICPDGISVGRTGSNCEFAECPKNEETASPDNFIYSCKNYIEEGKIDRVEIFKVNLGTLEKKDITATIDKLGIDTSKYQFSISNDYNYFIFNNIDIGGKEVILVPIDKLDFKKIITLNSAADELIREYNAHVFSPNYEKIYYTREKIQNEDTLDGGEWTPRTLTIVEQNIITKKERIIKTVTLDATRFASLVAFVGPNYLLFSRGANDGSGYGLLDVNDGEIYNGGFIWGYWEEKALGFDYSKIYSLDPSDTTGTLKHTNFKEITKYDFVDKKSKSIFTLPDDLATYINSRDWSEIHLFASKYNYLYLGIGKTEENSTNKGLMIYKIDLDKKSYEKVFDKTSENYDLSNLYYTHAANDSYFVMRTFNGSGYYIINAEKNKTNFLPNDSKQSSDSSYYPYYGCDYNWNLR